MSRILLGGSGTVHSSPLKSYAPRRRSGSSGCPAPNHVPTPITQATPDPLALCMLAQLRQQPDDEATRMALADRLADLGPASPVKHSPGLPPWLRKCYPWGGPGPRSYWAIHQTIFDQTHDLHGQRLIDHSGTAVVLGQVCYVSEPYLETWSGEPRKYQIALRWLAGLLGTVDAYTLVGHHNPEVARIILFPLSDESIGGIREVSAWVSHHPDSTLQQVQTQLPGAGADDDSRN